MSPRSTLLLTLALAGAFAGCTRETESRASTATRLAPTVLFGTGYIEPAGDVRRLVFKQPGVIAEVSVAIGQRVAAGEALMRLRDADERAAVAAAEAELSVARAEHAQLLAGVNPARLRATEADVEHSRKSLDRQTTLRRTGAATEAEFDLARTALRLREAEHDALVHSVRDADRAVATARVTAAETRLALAQRHLDETLLRAPFAGTVLEILRREGEAAIEPTAEPVLLFGDAARPGVRAEIDETHALHVQAGQRAEVWPRGSSAKPWAGRVVLVKPIMGRKTVFAQSAAERRDVDVIQAFIELDTTDAIPLGLAVDLRITTR